MNTLKKIANCLIILGGILLIAAIVVGILAGRLYEPWANWILVSACVCVWLGILFSLICKSRR